MAIPRDPNYDIRLIDTPDGATILEELPLILTERGKALDFSATLTSPLVTQIGDGSPQDKDLSRYFVKSQRDWSGGRGKDFSYEETDKFSDATADTRFPGVVMLPPQVTQAAINTASYDPSWIPAPGGYLTGSGTEAWWNLKPRSSQSVSAVWSTVGRATVSTARVKASWSGSGRSTDSSLHAFAAWSGVGRSNGKKSVKASWTNAPRNQSSVTSSTQAIALENPTTGGGELAIYASGADVRNQAQSFVPDSNITVSTLQLYLRSPVNPGNGAIQIQIQSDNGTGNAPSGTPIATYSMTSADHASIASVFTWFSCSISASLTAGVKYWIVVWGGSNGTPPRDTRWGLSAAAYPGGNAATHLPSVGWYTVNADFAFKINNGAPVYYIRQRLAQRFVTTGAVTLSQIQLYLQAQVWTAGASGDWRIETESGGNPSGTPVSSGTIASQPSPGWNTYPASGTLSATTAYWLVLEMPAWGYAATASLSWYGDTNQGAGQTAKYASWAGSWQAWSTLAINLYFVINTGFAVSAPSFTEYAPSFQALQQNFTPASAVSVTQVQLYLERLTWSGSPTLVLDIFQGASLVATASVVDPTATAGWKVISIAASLSAGVQYSLRLSASVTNTSHAIEIAWWCDLNAGFFTGAYEMRTMGDAGWSAWSGAGADGYFAINNGYSSNAPYFYPIAMNRYAQRQSFDSGAGGAMTQISLYLRGITWAGSPTVQIQLSNTSGTVLATATLVSNPGAAGWKTYNLSYTLAASTTYWITLMADAATSSDAVEIAWYGDLAQGYGSGAAWQLTYSDGAGFGAPASNAIDFYFSILVSATPIAYFYDLSLQRTRYAMRFYNATSITATNVGAYIERVSWVGSPTATMSLYSDATGAVGSFLKSGTFAPAAGTQWVNAGISGGQALAAATWYWLVIDVTAIDTASSAELAWHGDSALGYAGTAQVSTAATGAFGAWSAYSTVDLYFRVLNGYPNGPYFGPQYLSKRRAVQVFTLAVGATLNRVDMLMKAPTWTAGATLKAYIYAASGGAPTGGILTTATIANPGTVDTWAGGAINATLGAGAYCIVLEADSPGEGVSVDATVYGSSTSIDGWPTSSASSYTESAGAWGAWGAVASNTLFFAFNSADQTLPWNYTHVYHFSAFFEGFYVGASGLALNQVRLLLGIPPELIALIGSGYLKVEIRASSTGAGSYWLPTTLVATGTNITAQQLIDSGCTNIYGGWVTVPVTATLSANTRYHICLIPVAPDPSSTISLAWGCSNPTPATNYSFGSNISAPDPSKPPTTITWSSADVYKNNYKLNYFIINNGAPDTSAPTIAPVRHNNTWFAAMGTGIYQFNTGTGQFDLANTAGGTVTALASYGGKIYAALGDAVDMISSTTGGAGTWSSVSTQRGTYLLAYGFYLYLLKTTNSGNALAYYNGTVWASQGFPTASVTFTGLVGFRDQVVIFTTRGAYELSSQLVNQVLDYSAEEHSDNGRNAVTWLRDNTLVIPIRFRLTQTDGAKSQPIGLDMDSGLPAAYAGRVAMMVATPYWLFAAVDAGTAGRSGIYAYNGKGWHRIVEASSAGKRIRVIAFEATTSTAGNGRIWYFEDSIPYYFEVPSLTDNPIAYAGAKYADHGVMTSPRLGGELSQVVKDFNSIVVHSTGASSNQPIDIYLETDNSNTWYFAGRATYSPIQELTFSQPNMAPKTCLADCTTSNVHIGANSTTADIQAGQYVRIGRDIAQVYSIVDAYNFTLVLPLKAAPAAGTVVYPSRPAGVEIRYRLVLTSTDPTKSARVTRVSLRWMPQLLEKLRFTFSVKLTHDGDSRAGGRVAATAADIRAAIINWAKRVTPSVLVTPTGDNYRVKITSLAEREFVREEVVGNALPRLGSVITVTADEV